MKFDELWPNGLRLAATDKAFSVGTDAMLLADFTRTDGVKYAADLGCGSGVIGLLLAHRREAMNVLGIEIDPDAAEIAELNAAENGLQDRFRVHCGDMRQLRGPDFSSRFDLTVANPPYFPVGSGKQGAKATARMEINCNLTELCTAAAHLTRTGGKFSLIHRPERLSELFCALTAAELEPKRLRLVHKNSESAPMLALVESARSAAPGLNILPPLFLYEIDGTPTEELNRIHHR